LLLLISSSSSSCSSFFLFCLKTVLFCTFSRLRTRCSMTRRGRKHVR
jgi:hypothetical protein